MRLAEKETRPRGDLAPRTLIAAAVAGGVATASMSQLGLAGSLIGGAVTPIVVIVAREFVLRAADRVPQQLPRRNGAPVGGDDAPSNGADPVRPAGASPSTPRFRAPDTRTRRARRLGWRGAAVTAATAIAIVVGAFTLPELITGESLVTDRRSTFFDRGSAATTPTTTEPPTTPTTTDPAATVPDTRTAPPPATTVTETLPTPVPAPAEPDPAAAPETTTIEEPAPGTDPAAPADEAPPPAGP